MKSRKTVRICTLAAFALLLSLICTGCASKAVYGIVNSVAHRGILDGIVDFTAENGAVLTFCDLDNYELIEAAPRLQGDTRLTLDKTYEVRISYNLQGEYDVGSCYMRFYLSPTMIDGRNAYGEASLIIEDLDGNTLEHYQTNLLSTVASQGYYISIASTPKFFNDNYPDGAEIDEKFLTNGTVLDGIDGVDKGYITFTIKTSANPPE